MRQVVTAAQMKELDAYTILHHKVDQMVLMERAALAVVRHLNSFDLTRVLVVCGSGNNGGDGIAIARILHLKGISVDLYFVGNPKKRSAGCVVQSEIADTYEVRWVNNPQYSEYTTIVDAILGLGLSRTVTGVYAEVIQAVNDAGVPVMSVDIPSGVCADTGRILGCAIHAKTTVTFAFEKVGQLLSDGRQCCGNLYLEDIGIYQMSANGDAKWYPRCYSLDSSDLRKIPIRSENGNKGTFGKVLLIAGSKDMPGASVLCGQAILRTGAGMIKIIAPDWNRQILVSAFPEAMIASYDSIEKAIDQIDQGLQWADLVVMGPGIGVTSDSARIVCHVMEHCRIPLILDADGINVISQHKDWLLNRACPCILTPHMGELSRLLGQPVADMKVHFFELVPEFAEQYQIQCICKDAVTCIVMPDRKIYINQTGNCGMATAGSGDVLTGIIGGLLAVGTPMQDAGALGVYLHGMAGDCARERYGTAHIIAGDLIKELAQFRIGEERGISR